MNEKQSHSLQLLAQNEISINKQRFLRNSEQEQRRLTEEACLWHYLHTIARIKKESMLIDNHSIKEINSKRRTTSKVTNKTSRGNKGEKSLMFNNYTTQKQKSTPIKYYQERFSTKGNSQHQPFLPIFTRYITFQTRLLQK